MGRSAYGVLVGKTERKDRLEDLDACGLKEDDSAWY
jgi:hypothetical protein